MSQFNIQDSANSPSTPYALARPSHAQSPLQQQATPSSPASTTNQVSAAPSNNANKKQRKQLKPLVQKIGDGFWTIRGRFIMRMVVEWGNHMSIAQLQSGKFLILDSIEITPRVKEEIDILTNNGLDIEAVLCTHPFHSSFTGALYEAYPHAQYYGTPRHIRKYRDLPWAGSVDDCRVQGKWLPEIDIRVAEGCEFVAPQPEKYNHFCSAFVFHAKSKTIHQNDTILIGSKNASFFAQIGAGMKEGRMKFHVELEGCGLHPTPEAPFQFSQFIAGVIRDWDFDNICAAHCGNWVGGAKEALRRTLAAAMPRLEKLSERNKKKKPIAFTMNGKHSLNLEVHEGCECG